MSITILEDRGKNLVGLDPISKLFSERIIFIDKVIDDEVANDIISQMLYLDHLNNDEITIYINTPGGGVYAGLAIYDVGERLKSPIRTIGIGCAASMGGILMLMGKRRSALPHTRIMYHQPMGGAFGQASDMVITIEEIQKVKIELYNIIKEKTLIKDPEIIFDRDKWYTVKEALEVGILTEEL